MNMKIVICWEKKPFFVSRVTTHHKWDLLNLKRAVDVVCIARITLPLFSLYPAVLCTMWKSVQKADGPLLSSNLICNLLKQSQWNPADGQKRAFMPVSTSDDWCAWHLVLAIRDASVSYCLFGAQWVELHWSRLALLSSSGGVWYTQSTSYYISVLYCIFEAQ